MPRLLRFTGRRRWDFVEDLADWTAKNDLPAAPFGDLRPSASNKLSVWRVEDDRGNLNRIVAGMAASRANIDKLDAMLFDEALPERLGIVRERAPGNSKDREANKLWHFNLVDLTFSKVAELVRALAAEAEHIRQDEEEVTALVLASVKAGHIKLEDLQPASGPGDHSVWVVITKALKAEAEGRRQGR